MVKTTAEDVEKAVKAWLNTNPSKTDLHNLLEKWFDGDREDLFKMVRTIYDANKEKMHIEIGNDSPELFANVMVHVLRFLNEEDLGGRAGHLPEPGLRPDYSFLVPNIVSNVLLHASHYTENKIPEESEKTIRKNLAKVFPE